MADLTITAANVAPGTNAETEDGFLAETVTAGALLYKRATDGKFGLCDNNSSTPEVRTPYGIALNGGTANQGVVVQRSGRVSIGATVTVGTAYFSSSNPGGIAVGADNTSGKFPAFVGFATATTQIDIDLKYSGVSVP